MKKPEPFMLNLKVALIVIADVFRSCLINSLQEMNLSIGY